MEYIAGVKMLHVPYKGISQVVTDLLGENVDIAAGAPSALIPNIRAGKLKALASTSEKRLPVYPDVPSMWELGYTGFTTGAWYVVDVRAGTPMAIVNRLNKEINAALQQPATRKSLEAEAFAIDGDLTPAQTTKWVADEIQKWGKIVRDAKLSFD
jgi:tripartite-type tricarboxylate transporter receptor subunit TctC